MKKLYLFYILFLGLCAGFAEAGPVAVAVQSVRVAPYDEAFKGFEKVCDIKVKRFVISELKNDDLVEKIHEIKPEIVLAIGMNALKAVKDIKNIPVVYSMVLNPGSILSGHKNITGVSMNLSHDIQFKTLLEVLPDIKNIGLLYDPAHTGYFVEKAQDVVKESNLSLTAGKIHSPKDMPAQLNTIKEKADVFWMIPDMTVITPETIEYMLLFSIENRMPILTFSDKYVEIGAFMSLGIDEKDIGRQAGEMANELLSGKQVKDIKPVDARKPVIAINLKVAAKLGIHVKDAFIKKAKIVEQGR